MKLVALYKRRKQQHEDSNKLMKITNKKVESEIPSDLEQQKNQSSFELNKVKLIGFSRINDVEGKHSRRSGSIDLDEIQVIFVFNFLELNRFNQIRKNIFPAKYKDIWRSEN